MPAWPSRGGALSRLGLDIYYRRLPPAMPRLPGGALRVNTETTEGACGAQVDHGEGNRQGPFRPTVPVSLIAPVPPAGERMPCRIPSPQQALP